MLDVINRHMMMITEDNMWPVEVAHCICHDNCDFSHETPQTLYEAPMLENSGWTTTGWTTSLGCPRK